MVSLSMFVGALFLSVARPVSAVDDTCENGLCMQEDTPGLSLLQTKAQKTTADKYEDLGSGMCRYQAPTPKCPAPPPCPTAPPCPPKPPCPAPPPCPPKPKPSDPKLAYKLQEAPECRKLCDADKKCGGYSTSDDNNCILWLEGASDLMGGGHNWGNCKCYVKDKAGYSDLGSGMCRYQAPTPKCPAPPPCPTAPPCPPKPPCPAPPPCPPKPKPSDPKLAYKSQEAPECRKLCDADKKCGGYSTSDVNNCILWLEGASDLLGGGHSWGNCKCYVKK